MNSTNAPYPLTETINDWNPETRSLLRALVRAGFTLDSADNGEGKVKITSEEQALAELTACDDASLFVIHPSRPDRPLWIGLVFGNSPGELPSDYAASDDEACKLLDSVMESHYTKWEDRKQPTTERAIDPHTAWLRAGRTPEGRATRGPMPE